MPHHCCVPMCMSNSAKETQEKISFHSFPKGPLEKVWIINIKRDVGQHFSMTSHTKVCSLHFTSDCFYGGEHRRDDTQKMSAQVRRKFRPDAVLTIFDFSPEPARKRKAPADRATVVAKKKKLPVEQEMPSDHSVPASPSDHEAVDADQHKHCECVETLSVKLEKAEAEVEVLRSRVTHLEDQASVLQDGREHVFSISRIKYSTTLLPFYNGFTSYLMFQACFNFLKDSAASMRTWKGSRTTRDDVRQHGSKPGSKSKLCLEEQFFLVMTRLCLGLSVTDLADRFKVHPSTVSRIFSTWINLMYNKFHQLPTWLSRRKIDKLMPPSFKKFYPSTRVVIDCTEFFINIRSSFVRKSATWSSYKNHNTVK